MPARITPLVNGEFYHVYNRGVASTPTFLSKREYERFLLYLSYYRFENPPHKLSRLLQLKNEQRQSLLTAMHISDKKIVDLIAFCLMPNHFHLLVQQINDNGISTFMKKIASGYTLYFNLKNNRVGPLFQGAFKVVRIESDEQLLHLSRYIHLNPIVSYVVKEEACFSYPWSSLQDYLAERSVLVNARPVLEHFKTLIDYQKFICDQISYGKELERIKHLTFD